MKNKNWLIGGLMAVGYFIGKKIIETIQEKQYSFKDKTVVITGATKGLGLIMARKVAEEGANVVICARDDEELYNAQMELKETGANVLAVNCDITDLEQVRKLVEETMKTFQGVDVLINNAGSMMVSPYENNSVEDFEKLMKVHFNGPLYTMMTFVPYMRNKQEGARIVNVSSIGGKYSVPHLLPYSASKFALTGLSEGMYAALKKDNINVTTVCPGLMRTGSPRNVEVKGQFEEEYKWFKISDSIPLLSMSANNAAEKILNACKRGDAEVILSLPAKLITLFHGVFPGLTVRTASFVNDRLPKGTDSPESKKGYQTKFEKERPFYTKMTDDAAAKNNQQKAG